MLMASQALSEEQRIELIKQQCLHRLGVNPSSETHLFMVMSDERYFYDPSGSWLLSSLRTHQVDGVAEMEALMRQPLGALRGVAAFLHSPDQIIPEAFEEHNDKLCVVRQLAVVMGVEFAELYSDFELICGRGYHRRGVTSEEL
jgi:hypothetical protein